jgi:hypothetical protein
LLENERIGLAAFASVRDPLATAMASQGSREQVRANDLELIGAIGRSPQFERALSTMSRDQVKMWLEEAVAAQRPDASQDSNADVCDRLMKRVDTHVLEVVERRLSRTVARQLNETATRFLAAASDPAQLAKIRAELGTLKGEQAEALKSALGLPAGAKSPTEAELKSALIERAGLMRHESERVFAAGDNTTFRNLLLHSQVGPRLMEESGIREGSWMARGLGSVRARGESDESALERAKKYSATTMAFLLNASGMDSHVANATCSALFGSLSVMQATSELSSAKAGVSAGTADLNAEQAAQAKIAVTTSGTVASTIAAGIGLPEGTPHPEALEPAIEWGIQTAEQLEHHALIPREQGSQGDALTRLNRSTGR